MAPLVSVLLPVHRPPIFLPRSIASVLEQDMPELELLVVCDGAPVETAACARRMAEADPRVRVFENPKGARHGEEHRASAMAQARGRYAAHINDDSLWFPDHLSTVVPALQDTDFVNVVHTYVDVDDRPQLRIGHLERPEERARMLEEPYNFANYADVAFTMAAYRQLPEGWAPTPPDIWTDLHMWRKFLRRAGLRFATIRQTTTLFFDRPKNDTSADALAQMARWQAVIRDAASREALRRRLWTGAAP